ncbi:PREDICTED: MICOS complex subunit MIC10 isoform X3 [Rhinopithecus bieti]|uniref:MICOS complex subunit MIC10 isoform X3 n=1 Tax=Rhinopithecus bieti TaxID=61621 RepID=UPI00083C5646|nr:PREDICTED: MICOS complex subunit MIC10 isoform X3 [Rhinopithecus bieti]
MASQGRLCVHACPVGHPPSALSSHSGLGAADPGPPCRTLRKHSTHGGGLEKGPQRSALPSGHTDARPSLAGSQAASLEGATEKAQHRDHPIPAGELPSLPEGCKEGAPQVPGRTHSCLLLDQKYLHPDHLRGLGETVRKGTKSS